MSAWTPFQRATLEPMTPEKLAEMTGVSVDVARRELERSNEAEVYLNSIYQVNIYRDVTLPAEGVPPLIWLSIKRRDKGPVHDWRHFQRIKNELVGPECEAVELYPAESRLVDTANQYHLWVISDPAFRFPIGFKERAVSTEAHDGKFKQRGIES